MNGPNGQLRVVWQLVKGQSKLLRLDWVKVYIVEIGLHLGEAIDSLITEGNIVINEFMTHHNCKINLVFSHNSICSYLHFV